MFSGRFVPSVYNQRIPRTISVSNAPFSHLLAQPWLIFGRKRVFFHDFGHFPTFAFCPSSKKWKVGFSTFWPFSGRTDVAYPIKCGRFSIESPVFVASRPPACSNGGTQVFLPNFSAKSKFHFFHHFRPRTSIFRTFSIFRPFSGRADLARPMKCGRFSIERPVLAL